MGRGEGVKASDLDDADLERELEHLHATRHETFLNGSADALAEHTTRMFELEKEYADRFPARIVPDQLRTREGARAADGRAGPSS